MTAARGRNPAEELALQTTHAAETSGDSWLCGFSSAWNALVHELCCLAQHGHGWALQAAEWTQTPGTVWLCANQQLRQF